MKILKIGWWCGANVTKQKRNNIKLYASAFKYIDGYFCEQGLMWHVKSNISFIIEWLLGK